MKKTSWTAFFAVFFTLIFINGVVNHHETMTEKISMLIDLLLACYNWSIIINRAVSNSPIEEKKPSDKKSWKIS